MHAGKHFSFLEAFLWTRWDIFKFLLYATVVSVLYEGLEITVIGIPWLPVALIGTAVAFLIGFKNNATYDRLWEARKIWGEIVNQSRTWGIMSRDFITPWRGTGISDEQVAEVQKRLIYRHIAWLTALRFQLRRPRHWENMTSRSARAFKKRYKVPEEQENLDELLRKYLSEDDFQKIQNVHNKAAQILSLQSDDLKMLEHKGFTEDFRHMELEKLLAAFYTCQGKSERIKNFPYPRVFSTTNRYFVGIFLVLLPLGLAPEFHKLGEFAWLNIPFSTLVSWVYNSMEKIGVSTENPFQGGANDVPISSISRGIEIDLLEMLGDAEVPEPIKPIHNILM